MVKYSQEPDNLVKAAKAKGTHLRVHFKHTREIGQAIKGRSIANARSYLENVLAFKEAIPFTKYTGGIGRHAVAKQYKTPGDKVQWPQKATKTFLDLLRNIESNAEAKGLELEKVIITSVNCNQAPKMRRRTYRAHGRINAYQSSPAHIEIIVEEKNEEIVKEKEVVQAKLSKKQLAQTRGKTIKVGGGI
eukprot:GDKI01002510.1.p1 GENE.GDKI01002510.1~~GDKI01002510.1.p1  ORF type:complete len:190 (-),score=63.22 GDKI01002510.1:126-695(-)